MQHPSRILACVMLLALGLGANAQDADTSAELPEIEPQALEILKRFSDNLAAAKAFAYEVHSSYDVVQRSGVKAEFGSSRKTLVSRPDRLRVEMQRRDGVRGIIVFDGKNMWVYEPDQNVFAQAEQVGDLSETINYAVSELRVKAPLAELAAPDLYAEVTRDINRAYHLGERVVLGVNSHHLLFSNDYADFQLWITTGDNPVLQRVVITYREERGQPQFRAQFTNWTLNPKDTAGKFEFTPPADAERIRFFVAPPPTDLDQEDGK